MNDMTKKKILLADDSPTIHKVVEITLVDEPFEIKTVTTVEQLYNSISLISPNLILLDFAFDESIDAYQMAKVIRDRGYQGSIVALIGTLDTVDERMIQKSKIDGVLMKPFDSRHLVDLCHQMTSGLNHSTSETDSFDQNIGQDALQSSTQFATQWELSSGNGDSVNAEHTQLTQEGRESALTDGFEKELSDWSMEVPSAIQSDDLSNLSADDETGVYPSIIEFNPRETDEEISFDAATPSSQDLEYPDVASAKDFGPILNESTTSQLIPLDELIITEDELYRSDSALSLEPASVELVELVELSDDDLWKPDVAPFSIEDNKTKEIDSMLLQKLQMNQGPHMQEKNDDREHELLEKILKDETFIDELVLRITQKVNEKIQSSVLKEYGNKVEKVAWDIIPDLAETIITKEIRKIVDGT